MFITGRFIFTRLIVKHSRYLNSKSPALYFLNRNSRTCAFYSAENKLFNINSSNLVAYRSYAKGKDRGKDKKKDKHKGKVVIDEMLLQELIDVDNLKTQMQKAVDYLKDEFVKQLSLRSTTGAIETLPVHLDGQEHTLQELAQVVRKNPKTLVLNMSTFPQAIPAVLKSLEKSGMNLNPQQDGTTLFIPIPKVTKEHRENLAKGAKQLFVKCKESVRGVQIKYIKQLKNKTGVSQDSVRNAEVQVIAVADQFIREAEKILESKQNELLGKD